MKSKKTVNRIFKITDKVYIHDVTVFVGEYKFYARHLQKNYNYDNSKQENFGGETLVLEDKDGHVATFVWIPRFSFTAIDISTITHELLHAALMVLDDVKIPVNIDNQEPLTYYLEFLMTSFIEQAKRFYK